MHYSLFLLSPFTPKIIIPISTVCETTYMVTASFISLTCSLPSVPDSCIYCLSNAAIWKTKGHFKLTCHRHIPISQSLIFCQPILPSDFVSINGTFSTFCPKYIWNVLHSFHLCCDQSELKSQLLSLSASPLQNFLCLLINFHACLSSIAVTNYCHFSGFKQHRFIIS